jgi:hypothetical protein
VIDYLNLTEEERKRINSRMDKKLLKPRRKVSNTTRLYFDLGLSKALTDAERCESERIGRAIDSKHKKGGYVRRGTRG